MFDGADNSGNKDLSIRDEWIADNAAFQTPCFYGVTQHSFSTYFEKSASLFESKTWSVLISKSMESLTKEVLRACKTLLLGKRIKIHFPNSSGS